MVTLFSESVALHAWQSYFYWCFDLFELYYFCFRTMCKTSKVLVELDTEQSLEFAEHWQWHLNDGSNFLSRRFFFSIF